ncbi:HET-s/LopB domain protein [Morchella snyderi]|nr:HET-s/LopB domain protein [Morchella snyderi]
MAEAIGVISAVLGGADVCLRTGRSLYHRYRNYKDAEQDLKDLTLLLKSHWLKIEVKLSLIKDLQDVLGETLHQHFTELFEILIRKLGEAQQKIESVDRKQGRLKRATFAALVKQSLEAAIAELDKWQAQVELPYYLMALINNPRVDEKLAAAAQRPKGDTKGAEEIKRLRDTMKDESEGGWATPADGEGGGAGKERKTCWVDASELGDDGRVIDPYTTQLKLVKLGPAGKHFLVDIIKLKNLTDRGEMAMAGIRDVARILAQSEPLTFGILQCHGVVKEFRNQKTEMVFQVLFSIPERLDQPRSLRSYLVAAKDERRTKYPLNERFALAKRLARSIMFVHTSNLVHKNIRPDTIVLFQDSKSLLGMPFLVGFQKIRPANGMTTMASDAEWEKDLYRHPTRQGLKPEDTYKMQHDIYSLGVLLLEIGLWTSFVQWNESLKHFEPGPDLKVDAETLAMKDVKRKANIMKSLLLRMAMELLPGAMGPKYAEVAISCLTCLDKGNDKFESEEGLIDDDGIVVGVRYVEIVAMKLEEIDV